MSETITWGSFDGILSDDCDVITITIEQNALPDALMEVVLQSDVSLWKAIGVPDDPRGGRSWEISTENQRTTSRITLEPRDINGQSRLEFKKEKGFGDRPSVYSLSNLPLKITPGSRVTFHWRGDSCSALPKDLPAEHAATSSGSSPAPAAADVGSQAAREAIGGARRLYLLLGDLEKLLSEPYAFHVFKRDSVNFGIRVTYRQKWEPLSYQVGDLVSTIPLAPKEIRRYTTRSIAKKTRAVKEVDESLQIRKTESAETSRVDAEIVEKTLNKTSFNITAHESIGGGEMPYTVESTQSATQDQSKESAQVKKDFRESVLKSAQEYKQQHRMEVDTTDSLETEETTFHEIQNPNEELPVTYLFYELQRTYKISEKIHKLTPVIFVANDVPSPHQINDAWLIQHGWVLNRVILDDSFRPALEYLSKSFAGTEINVRILADNALLQKNLVDSLRQQLAVENQVVASGERDVKTAVLTYADSKQQQGLFDAIKSVFDPIGITGKTDTGAVSGAQSLLDYSKDTLDRTEREKTTLQNQLGIATTALQVAIDKLSAAVRERFDKIGEIDRLRIHVKENILYYMQAIWSHEPPDQRFFRLYNLDVPIIAADTVGVVVDMQTANMQMADAMRAVGAYSVPLPMPAVTFPTKKLVEVANLDDLLGFKGNYMIFPLKENNYLTLHMMQDYLEVGDKITVRDPDELGNYTLDELQELAACIYKKSPETFEKYADQLKKAMIDRLTSSRPQDDRVIVPTKSLYIEALLGTHPLLEDFKLVHRALDVKKVQSEVRHAELENIRLASRALKGKDEDPDIEKKIVIETDSKNVAVVPADT